MSALETFVEFLKNLEYRWDVLKKSQNEDEKSFRAEFNELISLTLDSCLDFRNIQPNSQIEEYWEKIKIIISLLKLEESSNQSINNVLNTEKWNSNFGQWLLSGKLIGSSNRLVTFDNKLLYESDEVISKRLESLMKLFQKTNSDDTGQMILNAFETYRKFVVRDVKFQCKLSSTTIEKLINYYMIILCHRKSNDHLTSSINLFPNHRKISFILKFCNQQMNEVTDSTFIKAYQLKIATRFIENLLKREFKKAKLDQDIKNYNLILQQLIEISINDKSICEDIEGIILSASDMNVISDYYYLAATQLRLQMPNKFDLIIKLISIGISHDFSYIQELKCSIDSSKDILESEYRLAYRRIYLALVSLGCIIKDYALRRLCFQAASLCEDKTSYCTEILRHLPALEAVDQGDNLDPILLDVRYLLETFQYDIKARTNLPDTFEKCSNSCLDTLEYFNDAAVLSEDLKPLEYPGVEKYLKRQAIEEKEHVSKTSDLDNCIIEIEEFNKELSGRLKKIRNLYTPFRKQILPTEEQIDLKIKEILTKSPDFRISDTGEMFYEPTSISFENILSPDIHWEDMKAKYNELNMDNLLFNFELSKPTNDLNIDLIYNSGIVDVNNLYCNGYSTYDIENVMLFTIMEKKMKFISEEFVYLNRNRNVESDEEQNQIQACFLYLANKPHPEYARLLRLSSTLKRFDNPLEYSLEYYTFDAAPGKYKYRQKNKIYKDKLTTNINESIENGVSDNSSFIKDTSMEIDQSNLPIPVCEVKREIVSTVVSIPTPIIKARKEKIPPAINLSGINTFNSSVNIQSVFKILQIEIAALIHKEVFIDISKISDISSPHLVQCMNEMKSTLPIKITRIRNGNPNPRELEHEIKLPINVTGKLAVILEFRDEIKYDEFFENPFITTTLCHRVNSNLTIDNLTHNAKCEIEFIVDGLVSKIRCTFQGQKAYRPRKKVQKPDIKPNPLTADQQVSVIQQPPKMEMPIQTISNNIPTISNIVMNVNTSVSNPSIVQDAMRNGISYPNIQPQPHYSYPITNQSTLNGIGTNQFNVSQPIPVTQQISVSQQAPVNQPISLNQQIPINQQISVNQQLPVNQPIPVSQSIPVNQQIVLSQQIPGTQQMATIQQIASTEQIPVSPQIPVTQQYSANMQPQYPCYAQSNENVNTVQSSVIQVPQQFTNGTSAVQQTQPQFPQQPQTVLQGQEPYICNPNRTSSPNLLKPKIEILAIEDISSPTKIDINMTGLKKISFSKPCAVIKDEPDNGFDEKFESSVSVMTIEKPLKQEIKHDDDLVDFEDEIQTTMLQSKLPKKSIHISEPLNSTNISLPKSPPPLHYPVNKIESNLINTQLSVDVVKDAANLTNSPPIRPNVIKSPVHKHVLPVMQISFDEKTIRKLETMPNSSVDPLRQKKIDYCNMAEVVQKAKKIINEKRSIAAVIDLTEDAGETSIDLTNDYNGSSNVVRTKIAKRKNIPDITFVECDKSSVKSSESSESSVDEVVLNDYPERSKKSCLKRSLMPHSKPVKKCKVYLVDVMKDIDMNYLKKENPIRLQKIAPAPAVEKSVVKPTMRSTVAVELPTEEQPQDTFVDNAYDATFTIVCHNSKIPTIKENGLN